MDVELAGPILDAPYEARRGGLGWFPMNRETFLEIAPFLDLGPDLLCFHAQQFSMPAFTGAVMIVLRLDDITPDVAYKFLASIHGRVSGIADALAVERIGN